VAAGHTHKNQLTGAIAALTNVGAPISGLVLTMLPTSGPDAYGYGHYGYGYSYGDTAAEPALAPAAASAPARARSKRAKA